MKLPNRSESTTTLQPGRGRRKFNNQGFRGKEISTIVGTKWTGTDEHQANLHRNQLERQQASCSAGFLPPVVAPCLLLP